MNKRLIVIISAAISLLIIGGAVLAVQNRPSPETAASGSDKADAPAEKRQVSRDELAAATGKDGKQCLVAVDGMVYEIKDFSLWQNGEHTTSNGEAYCGADMTQAIDKSPHGRRMLDLLIEVGPLQG